MPIKDIASYAVLNDFKNNLLKQNFLELPDAPAEEDKAPFFAIFEEYLPKFNKALVYDLNQIKIPNFESTTYTFVPEDDHAQGATIIYIKIHLIISEQPLDLMFKYMVFQGIIHTYLNGYHPNEVLNLLVKNNSPLIKTIAQNYNSGEVNHFYSFFR